VKYAALLKQGYC